jgi:hypothetical protein
VEIHLRCPRCPCHFSAPADTPIHEVLERMTEDGPWFTLAEGKTFEEMVFSALGKRGRILCPECRGEVLVGGESLGRAPDAGRPDRPRPASKGREPNAG